MAARQVRIRPAVVPQRVSSPLHRPGHLPLLGMTGAPMLTARLAAIHTRSPHRWKRPCLGGANRAAQTLTEDARAEPGRPPTDQPLLGDQAYPPGTAEMGTAVQATIFVGPQVQRILQTASAEGKLLLAREVQAINPLDPASLSLATNKKTTTTKMKQGCHRVKPSFLLNQYSYENTLQ